MIDITRILLTTTIHCVRQADAFSYGVVLWELITKEQTSRGNWRPVRVPEECPAEVEALIADCLTDDVERRPSMKDIVERLVALESPQSTSASVVDITGETHSQSGSTPPRMECSNVNSSAQHGLPESLIY